MTNSHISWLTKNTVKEWTVQAPYLTRQNRQRQRRVNRTVFFYEMTPHIPPLLYIYQQGKTSLNISCFRLICIAHLSKGTSNDKCVQFTNTDFDMFIAESQPTNYQFLQRKFNRKSRELGFFCLEEIYKCIFYQICFYYFLLTRLLLFSKSCLLAMFHRFLHLSYKFQRERRENTLNCFLSLRINVGLYQIFVLKIPGSALNSLR